MTDETSPAVHVGSPRVLWVTNVAAPYRLPVWARLAREVDLTVGLLEMSRRLQRGADGNRGADWRGAQIPGAALVEYRTLRFGRGEHQYYTILSPSAVHHMTRVVAVLLGGWESPAYWQLFALARALGKPTVGFYESTSASQAHSTGPVALARATFFRALDRVVVPGAAARAAVLGMGVDESRVLMGFNAVDTESFRQSFEVEPHAGHRFLYVGQFIPRKNIEAILSAFAAIAGDLDRLTLVGKGELQEALQALASELGVADKVDFVAHMANRDLPQVMANQDTLVLASHVEVWGLVVNEALAAGMQVVVTKNCGVAASVEGMPGVYLAAEDAGDLAIAMERARSGFSGRIVDPPILEYTPERFSAVFADAFTQAIEARGK